MGEEEAVIEWISSILSGTKRSEVQSKDAGQPKALCNHRILRLRAYSAPLTPCPQSGGALGGMLRTMFYASRSTHYGKVHEQHFHHQPRRDVAIHLPQGATARISGGFGLIQINVLRQRLNLIYPIDIDQLR